MTDRENAERLADALDAGNNFYAESSMFFDRDLADAVSDAAAMLRRWPEAGEPVWCALTDADRERAFKSMPDMLDGFLKTWGWLHFARAIEDECMRKNAAPPAAQPALDNAAPVSWDRLRRLMDSIPTREEFIGGQRQKYVAKEAVMGWLYEGQLRAEREAAQPALSAAVAFVMGDDNTKTLGPKCCDKTVTVRCPGCPHRPVDAPAQPAQQEGMVLVPREPTTEMLDAAYQEGLRHLFGDWSNSECKSEKERADKSNAEYYRAMIAASPAQPAATAAPAVEPLTDEQFASEWHRRTGRIMGTDKGLLLQAKYVTEAAHGITQGEQHG